MRLLGCFIYLIFILGYRISYGAVTMPSEPMVAVDQHPAAVQAGSTLTDWREQD